MTIAYTVSGNNVTDTTCYGNINSYLHADDFNGITLWLDINKIPNGGGDCADDVFLNVVDDDKYIMSIMRMARRTGFGAYIPRTLNRLKSDGFIHFDADVPFYVVVAVTGFFRAWDNHNTLVECYNMLLKRGLDYHTAFCGAHSLYQDSSGTYKFSNHGEHSVIPWTTFNQESVSKFKSWPDRLANLQSMGDEVESTGELNYRGRDVWFGAASSGNHTYFDRDGGKTYGCDTLKYLKEPWSGYRTPYVDIDALVAGVKSWR